MTSATMRAAVLTDYGRALVLDELPRPQVRRPEDVVVRVAGAGVCGSDVHLREGMFVGNLGRATFPYTLGHETVGTVEDVGSSVTNVVPGDVVALHPLITCGACSGCRSGQDMYCKESSFPGVDGKTHGGFAEFIHTRARSCVPLGTGLDPLQVVGATDAGLTAYHAVKRIVPMVRPGQTAVVLGVGGVGQFVVQTLRCLTSLTVVAADVLPAQLREARRLGAHASVQTDPDGRDTQWSGLEGGVDLVVDCVGTRATGSIAVALLRRGGILSIVGATAEELRISSAMATTQELTVIGNYVGSFEDLLELVALIGCGLVTSKHVEYSLNNAESALSDLAAGRLASRAVLIP